MSMTMQPSEDSWRRSLRSLISDRLGSIDVGPDDRTEAEKFYARHCAIRTTDGQVIPYTMRAVQKELEADLTGRDIVDKARKHGISTHVACRFYRHVTTRPNVAAAMVAHKPDATDQLWKIVQLINRMDPRGLKLRYASRKELFFEELNSYFVVLQAGKGAGRAGTYNYLHVSELAHWTDSARETLAGMVAAVPPRELGSEIIIESTANGEGNEFHRRYQAAVAGDSDYTPHFFAWHEHPEYVRPWVASDEPALDDEERDLQKGLGLTLPQIAFRRSMIQELGRDLWRQEYPATWQESFLASGRHVFDTEILASLQEEHEKPAARIGENGGLLIWLPPKRGRRYAAGVDTSEGVHGGDYQDVRVIDCETMEEVARLRGLWPLHVFARKSAALVNRFRAFVAVEKNNHGHAILEHWLRGEDAMRVPKTRLYHHRAYDQRGKALRRVGWLTDAKTKPIMVADLEEAIRRRQLVAHDRVFYTEARAYAHRDDGTMGAPDGAHDDSVMAMALALQARKHLGVQVGIQTTRLPTGL